MAQDPKNYRDPKVTRSTRDTGAMRWVWIGLAIILVLALLAWFFGRNDRDAVATRPDAEVTEPAGSALERTGEGAATAVEGAAEATGDAVGDAAQTTGDALEGAAEATGDAVGEAAEETGEAVDEVESEIVPSE